MTGAIHNQAGHTYKRRLTFQSTPKCGNANAQYQLVNMFWTGMGEVTNKPNSAPQYMIRA
eukprot:11016925-Karenia_brevis.AAC.1